MVMTFRTKIIYLYFFLLQVGSYVFRSDEVSRSAGVSRRAEVGCNAEVSRCAGVSCNAEVSRCAGMSSCAGVSRYARCTLCTLHAALRRCQCSVSVTSSLHIQSSCNFKVISPSNKGY